MCGIGQMKKKTGQAILGRHMIFMFNAVKGANGLHKKLFLENNMFRANGPVWVQKWSITLYLH